MVRGKATERIDPVIPGGWRAQLVPIGDHEFELLIPADAGAIFDAQAGDGHVNPDLGCNPYWAELWPTSYALAGYVLSTRWPAKLATVELGCGLGLVGIAAAKAGLAVTMTDASPLAVETAVANARRNGLTAVSGEVLNWKNPPQRAYDLVLASDVVYDAELYDDLLCTLVNLTHPGSVVWIADCGRSTTGDFIERAGRGWHVDVSPLACDGHGARGGSFQLLELRRKP